MTWWLAAKLFLGGWLKRLAKAAGALLGWVGRHPWPAAVLALLAIIGLGWWHYSGKVEKLSGQLATANQTIKDMKSASEKNRLAQLAQKARVEQHYKDIAHDADVAHKAELADANDALARYIASHRLRAGEGGFNLSPASGAPEGGSAGVPAEVPTGSFVAVSDDDLRRCTAAVAYAVDAHNWAVSLAR